LEDPNFENIFQGFATFTYSGWQKLSFNQYFPNKKPLIFFKKNFNFASILEWLNPSLFQFFLNFIMKKTRTKWQFEKKTLKDFWINTVPITEFLSVWEFKKVFNIYGNCVSKRWYYMLVKSPCYACKYQKETIFAKMSANK